MLGFRPLSVAPISVLAPRFVGQPVIDQPLPVVNLLRGGDDAWLEKDKKDLAAEYAKDKESRATRLTEAWENLYEPKPPPLAAVKEEEPARIEVLDVIPEPGFTSLEPFVFPAINITDEEIQAVMQVALVARQAAWTQRINTIKTRLAQASADKNADLLSSVQQPRLH
jgi:hypothetical protein